MNLIALVGMLAAVSAQAPSSAVDAEADVITSESGQAVSRSSTAVSVTGEWKAVPMNLPPAPKFWPPNCGNIINQTQADRCAQYQAVREARFSGIWAMLSMGMTAVAIMLAGLGWWDNRKSQRLEHRAYIRIPAGPWEMEIEINKGVYRAKKFVIGVDAINYGRTPAKSLTFDYSLEFVGKDDVWVEREPHPDPGPDRIRTCVAPGDKMFLAFALNEKAIQPALEPFHKGDTKLWLIATVYYTDVFGVRHRTFTAFECPFANGFQPNELSSGDYTT